MSVHGFKPEFDCAVGPRRIVTLDQRNLPLTPPGFQLLLASDSRLHCLGDLKVNEAIDGIPAGKSRSCAVAMFPEASDEIGGYANVQRAVTAAGEDINTRLPFHRTTMQCSWMLNQVQHDGRTAEPPNIGQQPGGDTTAP